MDRSGFKHLDGRCFLCSYCCGWCYFIVAAKIPDTFPVAKKDTREGFHDRHTVKLSIYVTFFIDNLKGLLVITLTWEEGVFWKILFQIFLCFEKAKKDLFLQCGSNVWCWQGFNFLAGSLWFSTIVLFFMSELDFIIDQLAQ